MSYRHGLIISEGK